MERRDKIELINLLKEQSLRNARGSLINFIEYVKEDYETQWFHRKICEFLEKLASRSIKKLMIFMPPQHGKSELSSIQFPSYLLGKNPKEKIAVCSYNFDLATKFNRSIQLSMDTREYLDVFPGTKLNSSRVSTDTGKGVLRNSSIFEIVEHMGYVKTVGVGGSLTGTSVTAGIIDDPFKDRAEANSETVRNKVWDWFNDVYKTRLKNNSIQLMLFTRWHDDDLAGRILDPKNKHYDEKEAKSWTVLVFQALKEESLPLEQAELMDDPREIDEALWEDWHNAEKYKDRRKNNPTGFNSLDQQRPSAKEGNKIKREWFGIIKKKELPFNPDIVKIDYFIDGAFTELTQNDETGLLACHYHKATDTLYILNSSGVRKELYELLPYFKSYVKSNHYSPSSSVYIELKASGHPLKSMLSKVEYGGFNARGINSKVVGLGKFNRVENSEPFIASGKVVLVEGGWNKTFVDQCASFPNGVHDDLVDVLTYAIHKYLIKKSVGGVSYE